MVKSIQAKPKSCGYETCMYRDETYSMGSVQIIRRWWEMNNGYIIIIEQLWY